MSDVFRGAARDVVVLMTAEIPEVGPIMDEMDAARVRLALASLVAFTRGTFDTMLPMIGTDRSKIMQGFAILNETEP